jgi:hypothetical protein
VRLVNRCGTGTARRAPPEDRDGAGTLCRRSPWLSAHETRHQGSQSLTELVRAEVASSDLIVAAIQNKASCAILGFKEPLAELSISFSGLPFFWECKVIGRRSTPGAGDFRTPCWPIPQLRGSRSKQDGCAGPQVAHGMLHDPYAGPSLNGQPHIVGVSAVEHLSNTSPSMSSSPQGFGLSFSRQRSKRLAIVEIETLVTGMAC